MAPYVGTFQVYVDIVHQINLFVRVSFGERSVECELLFMDLVCIIVHLQNGFCAVWRTKLQMKLSLTYFTVIYMYISNFYQTFNWKLDVRGSVHHSISHIKNPTRCNSVSKVYFLFTWSSVCFRRHTAYHQEPKTALAASGFAYVEGCWLCSCRTLSSNYTANNNPPHMHNQRLRVQF